jgi:hypothetical protein
MVRPLYQRVGARSLETLRGFSQLAATVPYFTTAVSPGTAHVSKCGYRGYPFHTGLARAAWSKQMIESPKLKAQIVLFGAEVTRTMTRHQPS